MRVAFVDAAIEALDTRDDAVVVLADISTVAFAGVPNRLRDRVINVGIREQALVGVAGGLALAGMVPIVHTYATFLIERAFEQIKLDLSHQDVPAVLVSIGASYDEPAYGRTHHAPGDVALLSTLGDWHIEVPSAAADVRPLLLDAVDRRARTYLRLSAQTAAPSTGGLAVVRRGRDAVVLAVGPLLDRCVRPSTTWTSRCCTCGPSDRSTPPPSRPRPTACSLRGRIPQRRSCSWSLTSRAPQPHRSTTRSGTARIDCSATACARLICTASAPSPITTGRTASTLTPCGPPSPRRCTEPAASRIRSTGRKSRPSKSRAECAVHQRLRGSGTTIAWSPCWKPSSKLRA